MDVTKSPLSDCFSRIPLEFSRLDPVLQASSQDLNSIDITLGLGQMAKTDISILGHSLILLCKVCP